MRVAAFSSLGDLSGITVQEFDDPHPADEQVVIDVDAAGINRHDLRVLDNESSWVGPDDLPYVPGADIAGTVIEVRSEVTTVGPGDEVVVCPNQTCGICRHCRDGPENRCEAYGVRHGGLAERVAAPADRLIPLPDGVSLTQAACLPIAYMTAWHMLRQGQTTAGDLVFIPGATGDVGIAAVLLARTIGARTICTSTSSEKLDRLADLGATHTLRVDTPEEMRQAVEDIGDVDVTLNHLGGDYVDVGLSVLRSGGRSVVCGRTTGEQAPINIKNLYRAHKRLIGSAAGTQPDLERVVQLVADGAFDPVIDSEYDLDGTKNAFARLKNRESFGKLLIRP